MTTPTRTITVAGRRHLLTGRNDRVFPALLTTAGLWLARLRERHTLVELTDTQLRDIGLTRQDVRREAERWPWEGAGR
ncbi:hypothetical protein BH10PSE9_BH10PSE9_08200 [soil metagenome]